MLNLTSLIFPLTCISEQLFRFLDSYIYHFITFQKICYFLLMNMHRDATVTMITKKTKRNRDNLETCLVQETSLPCQETAMISVNNVLIQNRHGAEKLEYVFIFAYDYIKKYKICERLIKLFISSGNKVEVRNWNETSQCSPFYTIVIWKSCEDTQNLICMLSQGWAWAIQGNCGCRCGVFFRTLLYWDPL